MFSLSKIWSENGFEIVLGVCLAIILIYGFYRILTKQKGSWSNSYSTYTAKDIDNLSFNNSNKQNKNIPKESEVMIAKLKRLRWGIVGFILKIS